MFRAKIYICLTLIDVYEYLKTYCTCISYSVRKPHQIVIRFNSCTFLLFSSGTCRIMGKASINIADANLNYIVDLLHTFIILPLSCVTQTVVFKLNVAHINLHKAVNIIPNSMFEAELFPSLVLNHFKPLHVNVFATGKVVVLGKNALCMKSEIENWLNGFVNV